jgi:hypothetical protein
MNVTDLARSRRDDRTRELALWPAYAGLYVELLGGRPQGASEVVGRVRARHASGD